MKSREQRNKEGIERLNKWLESRTPEENEKLRKKRIAGAIKRWEKLYSKMTQEEKDEYNKKRYSRSEEIFNELSEEEKEERREKQRKHSENYRKNMSEEKRAKKREMENKRGKERRLLWTDEQKRKRRERFLKWYAKNKKACIKRATQRRDERMKNDLNFRLRFRCNARLRKAIHAKSGKKKGRTMDLIGCSPNELRNHLERQFDSKMNWENYGTYWHMDHIVPCSIFDLTKESEQRKCFHYTNLRPLEAMANIKKGNKIGHPFGCPIEDNQKSGQ